MKKLFGSLVLVAALAVSSSIYAGHGGSGFAGGMLGGTFGGLIGGSMAANANRSSSNESFSGVYREIDRIYDRLAALEKAIKLDLEALHDKIQNLHGGE